MVLVLYWTRKVLRSYWVLPHSVTYGEFDFWLVNVIIWVLLPWTFIKKLFFNLPISSHMLKHCVNKIPRIKIGPAASKQMKNNFFFNFENSFLEINNEKVKFPLDFQNHMGFCLKQIIVKQTLLDWFPNFFPQICHILNEFLYDGSLWFVLPFYHKIPMYKNCLKLTKKRHF
jgi:hypothetical protein